MLGPHPTLLAERASRLRDLGPEPRWWRPLARRRWHARHRAIMAMDVSTMAWMFRQAYPASRIEEMSQRLSLYRMLPAMRLARAGTWVKPVEYRSKS